MNGYDKNIQIPASGIACAFGEAGERVTFAGRELVLRYLDINDLIFVQNRVGGYENLDMENPAHIRLFFYLVMRKGDPTLTNDDLDNEKYNLTEQQVGRLLTVKVMGDPATHAIIQKVMIGSGLAADPNEAQELPNETGARNK